MGWICSENQESISFFQWECIIRLLLCARRQALGFIFHICHYSLKCKLLKNIMLFFIFMPPVRLDLCWHDCPLNSTSGSTGRPSEDSSAVVHWRNRKRFDEKMFVESRFVWKCILAWEMAYIRNISDYSFGNCWSRQWFSCHRSNVYHYFRYTSNICNGVRVVVFLNKWNKLKSKYR